LSIHAKDPPRRRSAAGPKRNCSALDKPQFIGPSAARQAQNHRNPRGAREARLRLRRQRLVEYLHQLGPAHLYHFLTEVERGAPLWPHVERYAALPAAFIKANGGDQFAPIVHVIDGGAP
jgi:hypothetical protein